MDNSLREKQLNNVKHSFIDDELLNSWVGGYNAEQKKILLPLANIYYELCDRDPNLNRLLTMIEEYCSPDEDKKLSFEDESAMLSKILSVLKNYVMGCRQMSAKINKELEQKFSKVPASKMTPELIKAQRKYIRKLEQTENRKTAMTMLYERLNMDLPVFPHEPVMEDITPEMVENFSPFIGVASVARLYYDRIKEMITVNDDETVTVKLWKDLSTPVEVKVKLSDVTDGFMKEKGCGCMWAGILKEAFEKSEIKPESDRIGAYLECFFGPDFRFENRDDIVAATKNDKGLHIRFFDEVSERIRNGYPIVVYRNEDGKAYDLVGTFRTFEEPVERYFRLFDPLWKKDDDKNESNESGPILDVELEKLISDFSRIDINGSDELRDIPHITTIEYDMTDEEEILKHIDNSVTLNNFREYIKCSFDIYESLLANTSESVRERAEFTDFIKEARRFAIIVSRSYGSDRKVIEDAIQNLKKKSDIFRSTVNATSSAKDKQRVLTCNAIDQLYEICNMQGEEKNEPYKQFVLAFNMKFAEIYIMSIGRKPGAHLKKYKAELLEDDERYQEMIKNMSIVAMHNAGPKQVAQLVMRYKGQTT